MGEIFSKQTFLNENLTINTKISHYSQCVAACFHKFQYKIGIQRSYALMNSHIYIQTIQ